MSLRTLGFNDLVSTVILRGLCVKCGLCVSSCPLNSLIMTDYGPLRVAPCRNCEACYYGCPRSPAFSHDALEASIGTKAGGLGNYFVAVSTRSTLTSTNGRMQQSHVLLTLLLYALENGIIDSMILPGENRYQKWRPTPILVSNRDWLINAIESRGEYIKVEYGDALHLSMRYTNAPLLSLLKPAVYSYEFSRVAVVGPPCQTTAARNVKVKREAATKLGDKIALIIGVFCMGAFPYLGIAEYMKSKGIELSKITKFDIKEGKFKAYIGDVEVLSEPVNEVKNLTNKPCELCRDLTGLYTDISIGTLGSLPGWVSVIARTKVGVEVLNGAIEAGYLEAKDIGKGIEMIMTVARRKAQAAPLL
ncbi:MAG: Coenzyme F420 hydrogenase/dehydrogenase, beta subunit C-terminal domain [Candidatus Nezhaarchaeota archaeon]|nr:Coenzyme F420 hydrogenase/dehydrogenase, beta subunit C-terminal domain [Candidatus Nezhaarchaeota archaeon]MCX8142552.1 Coenzyme F420 hydrogenase/dehydrogenase, beta subunit C-terminal domain [Candidatus Nezhaarchaeota archaeon]